MYNFKPLASKRVQQNAVPQMAHKLTNSHLLHLAHTQRSSWEDNPQSLILAPNVSVYWQSLWMLYNCDLENVPLENVNAIIYPFLQNCIYFLWDIAGFLHFFLT